jgi:hypothetical protein
VKQADHRSLGLIPGFDRLSCRQQIDVTCLTLEIACRFLGEFDQTALAGADDQSLSPCAGRKCSSAPDLCAITSFCATITARKPSLERQAMNFSLFADLRSLLPLGLRVRHHRAGLTTRGAERFAVTRSPTDAWVAQQLRNATPFGEGPRYLIRDNDSKYSSSFARVAQRIEVLRTPSRAQRCLSLERPCYRLVTEPGRAP